MKKRIGCILLAAMLLMLMGCGAIRGKTEPTQLAVTTEPETVPTTAATEPETEPTTEATTEPTTEPVPQDEHFTLTFVGDCTLGSIPENFYSDISFVNVVGENYDYPFQNVVEYFENDDFTMVNLEGPLTEGGPRASKTFTFRGPTSYINILTGSSVEAVTLANNHSRDFGQKGYDSTVSVLEEAGITYVEKDKTAITTTESGLTIGLIAACFTVDTDLISEQAAELREQGAEIVVYAVHWGVERDYSPSQFYEKLACSIIDAGVDIVYGSHPHVLQKIEEYNGGIIYFSLGNFCFGGNHQPDDLDTVIVQQEVIRDTEGNVSLGELILIPASISSIPVKNNFQPTPYEEGSEEYERVLTKLRGEW